MMRMFVVTRDCAIQDRIQERSGVHTCVFHTEVRIQAILLDERDFRFLFRNFV